MDNYDYMNVSQIDRYSNLIQEDLTDTIEFEIPAPFSQKKKNLTFVENDVENGIIILNSTSCCFYKHSHNLPHDHFAISRGIQCGNAFSSLNNPLKMNSDFPNIQQNIQPKSPFRYFQYPRNSTVNQDNKPLTFTDYPTYKKWENCSACPSLRESEKFRKSQEESILNRSFTIDDETPVYSQNEKSNVLKSIMKTTTKLDFNNNNELKCDKIINLKSIVQYDSLCSDLKEVILENYSFQDKYEKTKISDDLNPFPVTISTDNNINSEFCNSISNEIPDLNEKTEIFNENKSKNSFDNEIIENKFDECEDFQQNINLVNDNDNMKTAEINIKKNSNDQDIEQEFVQLTTTKSPVLLNRKSKNGFSDLNNSNFHNESFQKFKHTSYFTESINSRNIVRAKYCSEKSVKHKFFLSENANIETILQDPSDRRIKAVCDKFNCDIDVYSKVIKSGYLKNIVVISAPNYDCLRKCVRSLDSNMSWCLTCQLNS